MKRITSERPPQKHKRTYLYTAGFGRQTSKNTQQPSNNMQHHHPLTVMATVLNKMAAFFSDMAKQCIQHLPPPDQESVQQALAPKAARPVQSQLAETTFKGQKGFKSHKPKHPVSSFFIFYKEKGQQIAKQRGEVLGSKIAKIVGQLWKKMPEAEKEPYETEAKLARQKYEQEMVHYKINYTDQIAKLKRIKRMARLRRKQKEDSLHPAELHPSEQGISELEEEMLVIERSESEDDDQLIEGLSDGLSDSLNNEVVKQSTEQKMVPHKQQGIDLQPSIKKDDQHHDLSEAQFTELDILEDSIDSLGSDPPHADILKQIKQTEAADPQQQQSHHHNVPELPLQTHEDPGSELVKPKGPISSFFFFYKAKKKHIAEEYGLSAGPKAIKKASQLWKALTTEQKVIYEEEAKETRVEYYRKMDQFKKHSNGEKGVKLAKKHRKKKEK